MTRCLHPLALAVYLTVAAAVSLGAEDWGQSIAQTRQLAAEQKCSEAHTRLAVVPESAQDADLARYDVAECFMKQQQWNKADTLLELLLRRPSPFHSAFFLRALALFRTQRYEESLVLISSYLEHVPNNAEAYKIRSLDYFMLKRPQESEQDMKRAIELNPSDAEAFYYLGRLCFTRKDLRSALAAFQHGIECDPTSSKAYNQLGQTHEALTEFASARQAYLKAIELDQQQRRQSPWPYYNLGLLCRREGKIPQAVDYLRQSVLRNPKWVEGRVKLAMALLDADKPDQALAELQEAIQAEPKNADAHYQMARVLSKLGKREQANQHFLLFRTLEKP